MHQRISRRTDKRATATLSTLAAALLACAAPGAHAGSTIELGADTTLDYTFTLSYGLGMRTRAPSGNLLTPANINGDDGDRNFAKNKLIENWSACSAK